MVGYNLTRSVEELLGAHESSPASFTVHLHADHWTLNGGSKFLYNNQIASLLDDIRAQRIPADFLELFDAAKLPFYDGCMIVELLDYRPVKAKDSELTNPKRSRVVLNPTSETLWADLCLLNHKAGDIWTDKDAVEVEAKILMATTPPLCLDPDPHLTRIANSIMRVSVPTTPISLKRKALAMEPEEDESDKARRSKIMLYMSPTRTNVSSYRILDVLERIRQTRAAAQAAAGPAQAPPTAVPTQHAMPSSYPLAARATPALAPNTTTATSVVPQATSSNSAPVPAAARKSATPAPPSVGSPSSKVSKVHEAKNAASQSPVISTRSPSAVPAAAAAIPPHMQHYQMRRSTPSPPSHTARPPSTAIPMRSPMPPARPLSVAQPSMNPAAHLQPQPQPQVRGKTPMPHHAPSPRVQPTQPSLVQAPTQLSQQQMPAPQPPQPGLPQSMQMQQPHQPVPNLHNANPANMTLHIANRRKTPQQTNAAQQMAQLNQAQLNQAQLSQAQMSQIAQAQMGQTPMNQAQMNQAQMNSAQVYQYMLHQQQQQAMRNQAQATATATQGLNGQSLQLQQRNSPAGRAQQPTPRPPTNPQPTPQMNHPQQPSFNYATLAQNQLNANLRPAVHGTHNAGLMQHQHQFPGAVHTAGQQGGQPAQDQPQMTAAQQQMLAQYQMYGMNYPGQMGMGVPAQQGRVAQNYGQWTMGRGMVPNISGHPQQMQLGAGKAGMQGSS